jgi:glycosyltransferase involved in cell wall biosynthesis
MVCGTNLRAVPKGEKVKSGKVVEYTVDGISVIEKVLPYSNHDGFFRRSVTFVRYAYFGVKLALTRDYDLLFATSTPLTAGIPGIFASIFRRKPFVFEVRDLWPELPREMGVIRNPVLLFILDVLESISYQTSTACIALSPGIAEGIRNKVPTEHPVAVISNASDLDLFNKSVDKSQIFPELPKGSLVCVFTGAHGLANGLDAAIDAASVLKSRHEGRIYFVFVGDGREKPRLEQRAKDLDLTNCIFMDLMPKERLAELLAASDVGMQLLANIPAFYYGTSPNKFFDYLASGLPIVNNYPGWLADLIEKHCCGIGIPPEDPEAFADAMVAMRDDPEGRKIMGRNARRLAERSFSRDELGIKFCEFLEDQVSKKGRG